MHWQPPLNASGRRVATVLESGDEVAFDSRITLLVGAVASGPSHAVVVNLEAGMGLLLQADARQFLDQFGSESGVREGGRSGHTLLPLALKGGGLP